MALSNDPNQTRGRDSVSSQLLRYPLTESPAMTTRLRFTKYSRLIPSDDPSEQTTSIIVLPLPGSIPDSTSLKTTGTVDLGALGLIDINSLNRGYSEVTEALTDAMNLGYSYVTKSIEQLEGVLRTSGLKALALAPQISDSSIGNKLEVFAGVVKNPHTNLIFEGVNLKSYTLTWRLSPRTQQESDTLQSIIDEIKFRSHPEEIFEGYALDYPDLIHINFTGDAGKYLPKIHRSMVNNIQINYGNGNGFSLYKSGAPIDIELALSITEVNIITRDTLRQDAGISSPTGSASSPSTDGTVVT